MDRIFISAQNYPACIGIESEQNYEWRDYIFAVNSPNNIFLATNLFQDYVSYCTRILNWPQPEIINCGPFQPTKTLTQLVSEKEDILSNIMQKTAQKNYLAEFFITTQEEVILAEKLGVIPVHNPSFAQYTGKIKAKKLIEASGCPTLPFIPFVSKSDLESKVYTFDKNKIMIKADMGTGGTGLESVFVFQKNIHTIDDVKLCSSNGIITEYIEVAHEISCRFEILQNGEIIYFPLVKQISENDAYNGGATYSSIDESIIKKIGQDRVRFAKSCKKAGATGKMGCDIFITPSGDYFFEDLNIRAGALDYPQEIQNLLKKYLQIELPEWKHVHASGLPKRSFSETLTILEGAGFLQPNPEGFIVITNPGLSSEGCCDITSFGDSIEKVEQMLKKAEALLKQTTLTLS